MILASFIDSIISFVENPFFIFSIIFWAICLLIVKFMGKKAEFISLFFPFLALFRTKLFNKFFAKCASKGPHIWRIIWNTGVIVSFGVIVWALYFFCSNLYSLIVDPQIENAIIPLIPGVTIDLPLFSYLFLPILFTMTIHEFSHAIASEIDGIKVKSSGVFGAGIFFIMAFGAFVELDEFELESKKYSSKTRLRIAAAGTWSNLIFALLTLLILNNFPKVMSGSYSGEVFQITNVVSDAQGGFNEKNVFPNDIVYAINGTLVDLNNKVDLSAFLENKTLLKTSIGDNLVLQCRNISSNANYNRTIILGSRSYAGFEIIKLNNSAFQVGVIDLTNDHGNNEYNIVSGETIIKFDGIDIDYSKNQTFEFYISHKQPSYWVNLTSSSGTNYNVHIDYYSNAVGAYTFNNFYTGLVFSNYSKNILKVEKVLSNSSNLKINEGHISKGILIQKINGISLDLENYTLNEFIDSFLNISPGDTLIFSDIEGKEYSIITTEIPIIPVYIGINHKSYWLSSNLIGNLFGGEFPNFLRIELYYTFLIGFSLALFNLLPIGIFDGGRIMKELIHIFAGYKYKNHSTKKIRYEYNTDETKQHLLTQNVNKILSAKLIPNEQLELEKQLTSDEEQKNIDISNTSLLDFREIDSNNDGFVDLIEITTLSVQNKSIIEIEVDFDDDLNYPQKKKIYQIISGSVSILLIANLLISIFKFGSTLFWL